MAKETVKNEVLENENKTEEKTTLPAMAPEAEADTAASRPVPIDPFASRRQYESEEDDDDIESNGVTTIYKNTDTFLYKYNRPDPKSKIKYTDLRFAYQVEMNGYVSQIIVNVKPVGSGRGIYDLINSIYGEEEYLPVAITKTETTNSSTNRKNITYGLQLMAFNSAGIPLNVVFVPDTRSDKALFNTYIDILKADGKIK